MSGPAIDPAEYRDRDVVPVKRALIAVSDKTGLVELATALVEDENLDAPSTGGAGFSSDASGAGTLADDESLAALREKLSGNV